MVNMFLNFFRSGTSESSKRLLTILSYVVSLGIAIFCVIAKCTLEGNILILLLGLSGVATTQQIIGSKKEVE